MWPPMHKYPRTPHLSGSALQRGDDPDTVPFRDLRGRPITVEEKLDGANCAVSFAPSGELLLQSRGHYLTGGPRERHFALLRAWAARWEVELYEVLGDRYVVYGEWLYAKHTVFYDRLPHYFHEFDVLDRERGVFRATAARRRLLDGRPLVSVPVLYEGPAGSEAHLASLVAPSVYKSEGWRDTLRSEVEARGQRLDLVLGQTEDSDLSEGLYVKWEDDDVVHGRYKLVRQGFVQTLLDGDGHWQSRPILPNRLAPGVDLFGGAPWTP